MLIMCAGMALPSSGAVLFMLEHQCIQAVCLAMSDYIDLFSNSQATKALNLIELGGKMSSIIEKINELFGVSLLVEISLALFSAVFNIFFSLSTEAAFSGPRFYPLMLAFGLTNMAWGAINSVKLFVLLYLGQLVCNRMKNVKTELQKLSVKMATSLTLESKAELELLLDHFSQPSGIRPCNLFDLNMSTGVTILAWVATNTIVLMQFRSGED